MTQTQRMGLALFLYLVIFLLSQIAGIGTELNVALIIFSFIAYGMMSWSKDKSTKP